LLSSSFINYARFNNGSSLTVTGWPQSFAAFTPGPVFSESVYGSHYDAQYSLATLNRSVGAQTLAQRWTAQGDSDLLLFLDYGTSYSWAGYQIGSDQASATGTFLFSTFGGIVVKLFHLAGSALDVNGQMMIIAGTYTGQNLKILSDKALPTVSTPHYFISFIDLSGSTPSYVEPPVAPPVYCIPPIGFPAGYCTDQGYVLRGNVTTNPGADSFSFADFSSHLT